MEVVASFFGIKFAFSLSQPFYLCSKTLRTYLRGSSGAYIVGICSYSVQKASFLMSTDTMVTISMSFLQRSEHFHLIWGVDPCIAMGDENDPAASQNEQNEQKLGKFSYRWYIPEGAV